MDLNKRECLDWVGYWRSIGPHDRMPETHDSLADIRLNPENRYPGKRVGWALAHAAFVGSRPNHLHGLTPILRGGAYTRFRKAAV